MDESESKRRSRYPRSPLAIAFGFSLLIHLLLFLLVEYLPKDHWPRKAPVLKSFLSPRTPDQESLTLKTRPKPEEKEAEYPLVLVQVPREQATAEPPKQAKYYSEVNSLAANPNPTEKDSETPKIEGKQEQVMRLADSAPSKPAPKPPEPQTPPAPPTPPQPTPKPVEKADPKPEPPKPAPKVEPTTKPVPPPTPAPPPTPPGALALNRPEPRPIPPPAIKPAAPDRPAAAPSPQPSKPAASNRPRTLAQVYQQNPQLRGEKVRQEGGVRRRALTSSLNVKSSTFASYDQAIVQAIEERWFQLLDENSYSGERVGKVVLEFKFKHDGTVSELKVAETSVGEVLALLCIRAIKDPSPFEKWPSDMRLLFPTGFREVRFTFYYN